MLLHYSPASPFAAKVRFAAAIAKINLEIVHTDTLAVDDSYYQKNPLGKIPMLETDDEEAVFDSRAITRFLDRKSGGKLYPTDASALNQVETMEALADGICEAAVAVMYEKKFRPDEMQHQPWIDRQWEKVERSLLYLEDHTPSLLDGLDIRHAALAAALGYLELRFEGKWDTNLDVVNQWFDEVKRKLPNYEEIKPQ